MPFYPMPYGLTYAGHRSALQLVKPRALKFNSEDCLGVSWVPKHPHAAMTWGLSRRCSFRHLRHDNS